MSSESESECTQQETRRNPADKSNLENERLTMETDRDPNPDCDETSESQSEGELVFSDEELENSDLGHLGASMTCVKSFSVERMASGILKRGQNDLAQHVQTLKPVSSTREVVQAPQTNVDKDRPDKTSGTVALYNLSQTIHVQQFGDVTVESARNLNIGGTQNISSPGPDQNEEEKPLSIPQKIRKITASRIEVWIKGMVKTQALREVLDKIHSGSTWITIKGSPGEGKSTVGYMALAELHTNGRQVFQVSTPEHLSEIIMTYSKPVIMLDDIFGDLEFDETEWLRWKSLLHQMLDVKEHTSHQHPVQVPKNNGATVILITRDYVLNTASNHLGRLSDFVTLEQHVVDMSKSVERELVEKLDIWSAIVKQSGVELVEDTILKICQIRGQHGFPHVCRLFVTMHHKNMNVSAEDFFQAPLEFLNQTIENFMRNDLKLELFEEIIKGGGKISTRELCLLKNRSKIIQTAKDLVGTYLKQEGDYFMFDHPSIYDSVAYNMCKMYPLFVIENCKLSFIHQRVRLQPNNNIHHCGDPSCELHLVVYIPRTYAIDLANRFVSEISNQNLLNVLSHKVCGDGQFLNEMMSLIPLSLCELFKVIDKKGNASFLSLVASNKSSSLLKYIHDKTGDELNKDELQTVLFGVCRYAATDALTYLTTKYEMLDVNVACGFEKQTPLMIAVQSKDTPFLHLFLSLKPDLTAKDYKGRTVLHYLCDNGLTSIVDEVLDMGADPYVCDEWQQSPLYYACMRCREEVVRLLLNRGVQTDSRSLVIACRVGNVKIVKLLFEKGATVDMVVDCEATPLHAACGGRNVEVIRYLIGKGASVNTLGMADMSPLHFACFFKHPLTVDYLLQQGALIGTRDRFGSTPLHKAAEMGTEECVGLLLTAGAEVNAQNDDGYTPLHDAVNSGSKNCVELLIKASADVNFRNKDDCTPLHEAATGPYSECVDLLLKAGADVNAIDRLGQTLLHKVIYKVGTLDWLCLPDVSTCQMLIGNGTDVNIQDAEGNTPLHLLCCVDKDSEFFDDSYCLPSPASCFEDVYRTLAVILIDHGADVNKLNHRGEPALRGWCRTLIST